MLQIEKKINSIHFVNFAELKTTVTIVREAISRFSLTITCSRDLSVISSHSYPNCSTCFVVELEALCRIGFDVIRKGCRLGEFVLILSYFGRWI